MLQNKAIHLVDIETERYHIRNIGKISFNPDHPFIQDFIEFKEIRW